MGFCCNRPTLVTYDEYCHRQQCHTHGCCFTPCQPQRPPCVRPCPPCGCKAGEYTFCYRGMYGEKVEFVYPIIKRTDGSH